MSIQIKYFKGTEQNDWEGVFHCKGPGKTLWAGVISAEISGKKKQLWQSPGKDYFNWTSE